MKRVATAALGTACGYLVASGLAAWLEPAYTWRILWMPRGRRPTISERADV